MNWYLKVLKKYIDFNGRARRTEYWMFVLVDIIFMFVAVYLDDVLKINNLLFIIYYLATIIPSIAVCVRRLHDIGKSGFWIFIKLIPLGGIWLLILLCTEGENNVNDYGENPKFENKVINNY